jgi:hypothetical protein
MGDFSLASGGLTNGSILVRSSHTLGTTSTFSPNCFSTSPDAKLCQAGSFVKPRVQPARQSKLCSVIPVLRAPSRVGSICPVWDSINHSVHPASLASTHPKKSKSSKQAKPAINQNSEQA